MDIAIKRPILVGGLSLSASLWLLDVVHRMPVDGSLVFGAIALGSGLWWLTQQNSAVPTTIPKQVQVQRDAVDQALERADSLIDQLLAADSKAAAQAELYRTEYDLLLDSLERSDLKVAIAGHKATGKTALRNCLHTSYKSSTLTVTDQDISDADLVLLLVTGDMTASELNHLETMVSEGYQVLVVLNKQDQYTAMDKALVLERIKERVAERGVEVVAIAAKPNPIKVRRHLESGEVAESFEQPAVDITALTQQLNHIMANPTPLVMATALRQAKVLHKRIIQEINLYRRQKALPVIEQMQWIAAGTAFANPLITVDLLATAAISGQLVLDLSAIYGQKFSVDQAKAAAGTIAELTVKLGLVELASQALGTVLKSHITTYVAGGALQGVSAAYLTRLAGLALVDYFEEQSLKDTPEMNFVGFGDRLQTLFKQARQGLGLKDFVTRALPNLPAVSAAAN